MNVDFKLIDEGKIILKQLETELQKRKTKKQELNDAVVAKQETDQIEFRTTDKFTTISPNVDKIKIKTMQ